MKKTFLFIAIAFAFVACNKIEGPYLTPSQQEEVNVVFPDLDPSTIYRKILFDEYTGHQCSNCPAGHDVLNNLLNQYGDSLIAVCIHAGSQANLNNDLGMTYDFTTNTGNQLYNDFGQPFNPGAIINRSGSTLPKSQWYSGVQNADNSLIAAIQIINQFDESNQILKINTKTSFLADYDRTVLLSLLLVEDGIVKPQILFDGQVDENYTHNHVLRQGINGDYGTYISSDGLVSNGSAYLYGHTLDFSDHDWAPENCSVIAILLDESSKEAIQVEKARVK